MTLRFTPRPLAAALLLAATLIAFTGCDTSDPVPSVEPVEVSGTYDFTAFRFAPNRTGIAGVNLLDSLVVEDTFLELAGDGDFRLTYRFEGETFDERIRGTFVADRDEVVLRPRTEDQDLLPSLLLSDGTLAFQRESETVLVLDETVTVDLEAFDEDAYGGIEPQPGTLTVRLQRRAVDPAQASHGS